MIDDIFLSLGLDKCEWMEDIESEDSSLAAYKVKLATYKTFGNNVDVLACSDAGTRLLFKFRSGLNEELGRHRGTEGKSECTLCGAECESVVHVLWECLAYSSSIASFMSKLEELLGDTCMQNLKC